jgi:vacuolar-type H+-ATPase subunit E/Vma4
LARNQLSRAKLEMTRRYIQRAPKILAGALETKRENVLNIETENATNKI